MSKSDTDILEELIKSSLSPKEVEQRSRNAAIRSSVSHVVELLEEKGEEIALEHATNSLLTFTSSCFAHGQMEDWLPFIIDTILVSPTKEVQTVLRNAANVCVKGLIVELIPDNGVTPLTDMHSSMDSALSKAMSDPEVGKEIEELLKQMLEEGKIDD